MLQFAVDPRNHSTFDETVLDFNVTNDRGRVPLFYCFCPPVMTSTAFLNGIDSDGTPIAVKPEDIESMVDWVKVGGPKERQDLIELMLDHGAKCNVKDYHDFTCLHYACMWGWAGTVEKLLAAGADRNAVNVSGRSPLMTAIEFMYVDCVRVLTSEPEKLDLHMTDIDGLSPLIMACELENNQESMLIIVDLLLKAGFDADSVSAIFNKWKCAIF